MPSGRAPLILLVHDDWMWNYLDVLEAWEDCGDFEGNEDTYDEKVEFSLKGLFLAH